MKTEKRQYTKFAASQMFTLEVSENPKKLGSKSRARFDNYFSITSGESHFTFAQAIESGLMGIDIRHDLEHGFIALAE